MRAAEMGTAPPGPAVWAPLRDGHFLVLAEISSRGTPTETPHRPPFPSSHSLALIPLPPTPRSEDKGQGVALYSFSLLGTLAPQKYAIT